MSVFKHKKNLCIMAFLAMGTFLGDAAMAVTVAFDVLDVKTGKLLLTGVEDITEVNDRIERHARYLNRNGETVQTETFAYGSEDHRLRQYDYRDPQTGEAVDVTADGEDHVKVSFLASTGGDTKTGRIRVSADAIHGKAIPEVLLRHWDSLVAGNVVSMELIVPSRLETIRFRGRYDADASARAHHPIFVVDAENWFLRLVAPKFTFAFDDAEKRQVTEYVGPSPVEINGSRFPTVRLRFAASNAAH